MTTDQRITEAETLPGGKPTTTAERARSAVRSIPEADAPTPSQRHRWRVPLIVAVSVLVALALAVGAFAVAQATAAQASYSVLCFDHASTSSGYVQATSGTARSASVERHAADPAAICASAWRVGQVGQKVGAGQDQKAAHLTVPPLVACTMANGVGAAFPREGSDATVARFCNSLGLTVWSK
jgi:hypothetical protein